MATVEMTFTPLPAHVRTARLVATAVARRSGVPEALLDEVRLAVGEACSRAVGAFRARASGVGARRASVARALSRSSLYQSGWLYAIASPQYAIAKPGSRR